MQVSGCINEFFCKEKHMETPIAPAIPSNSTQTILNKYVTYTSSYNNFEMEFASIQ